MTSMEYEVDSMGGLMPQILALTAPPGTRDPNRQQGTTTSGNGREGLAAHPYFRRPGRGHNHDSCDACGEGGDLICCDLCPASFHLTCHDPPLDEKDIPMGQWVCHQCRLGGPEDDRTSVSSGKSNKSSKGIKRKEKDEEKPSSSVPGKYDPNEKRVCSGGREFEISDSPLFTLIKAAASVNPKQFTLPYEMTLPVCFPGEPKNPAGKTNGTRKGSQRKKSHELDNGLVPLPAKLCFQCNKSCRVGPLVPCDYCPLFFHLDCLDPPLTTPPMGKWMCPNHPQHFLDSALLTSHSLSERVKLWDKFNAPVDQDAVRLSFLQRCHRQNPPFRFKVKRALRSRIRVPLSVQQQYLDPPELLPRHGPPQYLLPSNIDGELEASNATTAPNISSFRASTNNPVTSSSCTILQNQEDWRHVEIKEEPVEETEGAAVLKESIDKEEKIEDRRKEERRKATKEEKDEWLASLLCFQASIVKHMANDNTSTVSKVERPKELNGPSVLGNSYEAPPVLEKPGCMNGDLTSHDINSKRNRFMDNRRLQPGLINNSFASPTYLPAKKGILKTQKGKNLNNTGIKTPRQRKLSASEILSETLTSLASSLRDSITGKQADVTLSQLERSVVEVLAWQRLEELLCPPDPSAARVTTKPLPARALLCPLVPDSHLQDWAVKPPTPSYSTQPVPMTYRIIHIGKGSHNHADLSTYGHCNYISPEHAAIFYDENTGHYELLNYSPHGTLVDGIEYRYDHSEKTVSHAPPPPLLQQVRAIINQRRNIVPEKPSRDAMTDTPGQTLTRCNCKRGKLKPGPHNKSPNFGSGGWEGGAVLHHGSHLRFGCLQFVFSIVDEASKADWVQTTINTYDKFFKQEEEEQQQEEETKEEADEEEDEEEEEEEDEEDEDEEKKNCKKDEKTSKS